MKTLKLLFVILIVVVSSQFSYSQQDSIAKKIIFRSDTLLVGKYYSFYMKLGESLMGKLISLTEDKFIVYAEKSMEEIDTAKIVNILNPESYLYGEYKESKVIGKNKVYYYFGAGYTITNPGHNRDDKYLNGFNFNVSSLFTFNQNFGIRTDFDYYHFEKEDYSYSYIGYNNLVQSESFSGRAINSFLLRANLTFGSMNPDDAIQVYLMPAIGTGLTFNTKENYTYTYENNQFTSSYGGDVVYFSIGVSLGIGLNAKITKKIRGFAEYQYNIWYLGGYGPPSFSAIKLGIVL